MPFTDDDDIKALFEKVAEHFEGTAEGGREMFQMLVATTLKYRDLLMHSTGVALTVAETRAALDAFMETLKTHRIRPDIEKRIRDLVILWLEELRTRVHH